MSRSRNIAQVVSVTIFGLLGSCGEGGAVSGQRSKSTAGAAGTSGSTSTAGSGTAGGAGGTTSGGAQAAAGVEDTAGEAGAAATEEPQEEACPAGEVRCGEVCIDPNTDPEFCGASDSCDLEQAGQKCEPDEVCNGAGQCAPDCIRGTLACEGRCVDPLSNREFCGAAGTCSGDDVGDVCEDGQVCSDGVCALSCAAGTIACAGRCIDPNSNRSFCGASGDCDSDNDGDVCAAGELCAAGSCELSCAEGTIDCSGRCVDPQNDRAFCGASNDCADADSGEACASGEVCSLGSCETSCGAGLVDCGGSCVDPSVNRNYCGASGDCTGDVNDGVVCTPGRVCSDGVCRISCIRGTILCGGRCVDPGSDRNYCGASSSCAGDNAGEACADGEVCADGVCATSCPAPLIQCGSTCVDPATNRNFCGASEPCDADEDAENDGTICAAGDVCADGICGPNCAEGTLRCGDECVNPLTNREFCGANGLCDSDETSGVACSPSEVCVEGSCTCAGGTLRCGEDCIDPETNRDFCGATAPCDSDETDGSVCATGELCVESECELFCGGGTVKCGEACIDPDSNPNYCGATAPCDSDETDGAVCGDTEVCSEGQCTSVCGEGAIDCEGQCVNPSRNAAYCGAAAPCSENPGQPCADNEVCIDEHCETLCEPGETRCDGGQAPDFCANLDENDENCGACGNSCDDGERCNGEGSCIPFFTSCLDRLDAGDNPENGEVQLDPEANGDTFNAYCDMVNGGWTLIARFANDGDANWIDSPEWWYSLATSQGDTLEPASAGDMIGEGFWRVEASELRLTRTDDAGHTALLETTSMCLSGSLRATVSGLFSTPEAVWGDDSVLGTCDASFGGAYASTAGFSQADCAEADIGENGTISFFADWANGDGAVIMIGGGGDSCSRADHGIGVTEEPEARFGGDCEECSRSDFGDDGTDTANPGYALNLWVR